MESIWSKSVRVEALLKQFKKESNSAKYFGEYFDIGERYPHKSIVLRKALAINEFLNRLVEVNVLGHKRRNIIRKDELIVGVIGHYIEIPNYLTKEERLILVTNNSNDFLLEHNTLNLECLLENGLEDVIVYFENKLKELPSKKQIQREEYKRKMDTYIAMIIICRAMITYAEAYAHLAEVEAECLEDTNRRKEELIEIARVCRKVPRRKPDTYREALQSIFIFHVAFHCSFDYVSLGRLDQLLNHYLDKDRVSDKKYVKECIELFSCFLIKLAEVEKIRKIAKKGMFGGSKYQQSVLNIMIGGITVEGMDASNPVTHIILNAFSEVDLETPSIYIRVSRKTPQKLIKAIARVLSITKNNPNILNDDILLPQLYQKMRKKRKRMSKEEEEMYIRNINDYCIDGCWEKISEGFINWSFVRLNGEPILKSVLNRGRDCNIHSIGKQDIEIIFLSQEEEYERVIYSSRFLSPIVSTTYVEGR